MRHNHALSLCLLLIAPYAFAQEAGGGLSIELNRVDALEDACRLTFLAENTLGSNLEALSLETVLIDAQGRVVRRYEGTAFLALQDDLMTLLDTTTTESIR